MIKTLAYLMVSMTGGAAALSWFEPDLPMPEGALAQRVPLQVQFVDILPDLSNSQWKEILISHDVDLVSGPSGNIPLQAKRSGPARSGSGRSGSEYHFLIYPDGSLAVSQAWREQQMIRPGTPAITICLLGNNSDQQVPSHQWKAFMRLIQGLQARCGISPNRIHLEPASDPTKCPEVPPQTQALHQLLVSVGLAN